MEIFNFLTHIPNLWRKIYSVVLAIIIWVVIYNIYDPIITVKIDNIQVSMINEESLTSLDKVYAIEDNEDIITIYLTGKQSVVKNIKASDCVATANLENLSITNAIKIDVSIPKLKNENVDINYEKNDTIHLLLDNYVSKRFNVEVNKKTSLSNAYYLVSDNFDLQIEVAGAETDIKNIAKAQIDVSLEDATEGFQKEYKINLYDNKGIKLDIEKYNLSQEEYLYSPTIYRRAEIPINVNCTGNMKFGYSLKSQSLSKEKIVLAASSDVLAKYDNINISYDISGIDDSKSVVFDLKDYLPNEIIILDNDSTFTLNLEVDKLVTKEYKLTTKDLTIKNLPEGCSYKYNTFGEFNIVVMGSEETLESLDLEKLAPYIDVDNQSEGSFELDVKIPSNNGLNLMSDTKVLIDITNQEESEILETSSSTEIEVEEQKEEEP